MSWDKRIWNRHLRNVRSALAKRDTLMRKGRSGLPEPAPAAELKRQRTAWAAQAKANLKRLAALAEDAPDRPRARETVRELDAWYREPSV
jgi:hypothetical protein